MIFGVAEGQQTEQLLSEENGEVVSHQNGHLKKEEKTEERETWSTKVSFPLKLF